MRRLILSLWFVLSLFPLAAVPGCGDSSQTPPDFGNAPIELPQHVGYALAYIHRSIVAIDLDKCEAVGIHRICTDDEYVEDFTIGPFRRPLCVRLTEGPERLKHSPSAGSWHGESGDGDQGVPRSASYLQPAQGLCRGVTSVSAHLDQQSMPAT